MYRYLSIFFIVLSLNFIKGQSIESLQNSTIEYRIQFLSKTYVDSTYFYNYCDSFNCNIEVFRGNLVYYRYQVLPESNTIESTNRALQYIRRRYSDAFIVKYVSGKRIN